MSLGFKQSTTNGQTNGYTNGTSNGYTNGRSNGYADGYVNGNSNGYTNGHTNGYSASSNADIDPKVLEMLQRLDRELKSPGRDTSLFHGDELLADKVKKVPHTLSDIPAIASMQNISKVKDLILHTSLDDIRAVVNVRNAVQIVQVAVGLVKERALDAVAAAKLIASLSDNSIIRNNLIESQVVDRYDKMLHPPLTYLGDAFQYRTADGKFNNVLSPHLGHAGAPYAKTVPSQTRVLGALPDPGDIFDRLMARQDTTRESSSGLSSMLIYHATIIIHDIFRSNTTDKNISDTSSYLDLSPLYGYTDEMQRKVRDDKYKLGLLKPDTFAEDRLLRQPPGVCIYLVMYNRYHNYAATQLRRINENGRFSVPSIYQPARLVAVAKNCVPAFKSDTSLMTYLREYESAWKAHKKDENKPVSDRYSEAELQKLIDTEKSKVQGFELDKLNKAIEDFETAYDAAWTKLDDDLFNTARLITCGLYVNISIHDYLRALMGLHQYDTTFTLDPRISINKNGQRDAVSRGIGNQVTTEFNLLYRFHCAISGRDEEYTKDFIKQKSGGTVDPNKLTWEDFMKIAQYSSEDDTPPEKIEFGITGSPQQHFARNCHSGLFDDKQMVDELMTAMEAPIGNFGAQNVPQCLKQVEVMGILQARKWEVGTLNDFREFFQMKRHKDFESITSNKKVQEALRDLYDHPDKVELYPGIFCEGDKGMSLDPGPARRDYALWVAIFSDAITLVRSDRFYTVDWNTNSLTSWGMKEVTPDMDILKSSVFHRLLQRAFPQWFPYDSIRFFHPFYTAETNCDYARKQGYAKDFKIDVQPRGWGKYDYDYHKSEPKKPKKPTVYNTLPEVKAILCDKSGKIRSPASFNKSWLPADIANKFALQPLAAKQSSAEILQVNPAMFMEHFTQLTRSIIKREYYAVDNHTYQIDATRDLAIPVVTRYVAEFLGFSDKVKSVDHTHAQYTENEIYQHITNCQVFFSYISDETKIWERRVAAQKSITFLLNLTENGHIKRANSWLNILFGRRDNPKNMSELGLLVARKTLRQQNWNAGKAAAVLLMTALDGAYNSVLTFTCVLNRFMKGLYREEEEKDGKAGTSAKVISDTCDWKKVQAFALQDTREGDKQIRKLVLQAAQRSVRLPIVRKVAESGAVPVYGGKPIEVVARQTIICDVHKAFKTARKADEVRLQSGYQTKFDSEEDFWLFGSNRTTGSSYLDSREVAISALTAMIKVLAQTKNLRRGHDSQGKVKKVNLDETLEGYANYIAPGRMHEIKHKVQETIDKGESNISEKEWSDAQALKSILNDKVLQPRMNTYLTAEWDEMIPFPSTWKVRFDGYGPSDYSTFKLNKPANPDNFPPFYQPRGPSSYGGSFGGDSCPPGHDLPAAHAPVISSGCGAIGR